MLEQQCVFCKIIRGEIPSEKLFEDDDMIIIKDIEPKAPIHLLMIIKNHHKYLSELNPEESVVIGKCLNKLSIMHSSLGLDHGYRIICNQGDDAGQTVDHIHFHILAGKKLDD